MVIYCLQNGREPNIQGCHIFKAERIPEHLDFLTFRISHDLSRVVDDVTQVKNIQAYIICQIGVVNLLQRSKA